MAAQREARGGIVPDHFFTLGRFRQRQQGFIEASFFQQLRRGVQGRRLPDLLAAVP